MKGPIKYIKLNLVATFNEIVSFSLTQANFGGQQVSNFLAATSELVRRKRTITKTPFLLLDNGPKNRTDMIKELAAKRLFRLIFTTPTSPQQNFAECLFVVIKRKLKKSCIHQNTADRGLHLRCLLSNLFGVLRSLTQKDFEEAKRAYCFDLKSIASLEEKDSAIDDEEH